MSQSNAITRQPHYQKSSINRACAIKPLTVTKYLHEGTTQIFPPYNTPKIKKSLHITSATCKPNCSNGNFTKNFQTAFSTLNCIHVCATSCQSKREKHSATQELNENSHAQGMIASTTAKKQLSRPTRERKQTNLQNKFLL